MRPIGIMASNCALIEPVMMLEATSRISSRPLCTVNSVPRTLTLNVLSKLASVAGQYQLRTNI